MSHLLRCWSLGEDKVRVRSEENPPLPLAFRILSSPAFLLPSLCFFYVSSWLLFLYPQKFWHFIFLSPCSPHSPWVISAIPKTLVPPICQSLPTLRVQSNLSPMVLSTVKNVQRVSCELSFIGDKIRLIAWETASQIALRNRSEEVGGGQGVSVHMWFRWRGIRAIKHTFWQKVAASHEEQMSLLMILVLFYIWEDARIWAYKIFS